MAEYIKREAALQEIERREAFMAEDKCVSIGAINLLRKENEKWKS